MARPNFAFAKRQKELAKKKKKEEKRLKKLEKKGELNAEDPTALPADSTAPVQAPAAASSSEQPPTV